MPIAEHARSANSVLGVLPPKENQRLFAHSEQVNLTYGDVLCEPGKQIRHVYFPNTGVISLLTPLDGHESVEVGLVGREGMAGMALFLGIGVSPVRMLVQGSGTATRMKAESFRNELKQNPMLQLELNHYLYTFMAQVAQTAACNRHHQIGERLARWLLMTHDRLLSNEFRLTQEFLAHMLGVRRVGVTRAAGLLQEKKLISYRRGNIIIHNRKGLERASCRCYRDVNNIRDRMLDDAADSPPILISSRAN
ncbi:MAG: Crp/Fnr family transcriptional regulator [Sulfuricaulis sp.]